MPRSRWTVKPLTVLRGAPQLSWNIRKICEKRYRRGDYNQNERTAVTFEEFCQHFRHGAWRKENNYRRECERSIALYAIDNRVEVEPLLHHWEFAAKFREMDPNDKVGFRRQKSDVRQSVKFWDLLDPEEQNQFRTGGLLPYRAVELIRHRRSSEVIPS